MAGVHGYYCRGVSSLMKKSKTEKGPCTLCKALSPLVIANDLDGYFFFTGFLAFASASAAAWDSAAA